MPVYFHTEDTNFDFQDKHSCTNWITSVVKKENATVGEINLIFCSDKFLLNMNREYLNHDFFTDVITFDYTEEKTISGDIFISIQRVEENAGIFNTSFKNELNRVIVHGVLHLLEYADKTDEEKRIMRNKENEYLKIL